MRKLRPARMRSATARAASSGLLIARWILFQQRLDPPCARGSIVVAEIELRGVAEMDPLAQKGADAAAALLQLVDHALRLFFLESADVDAGEAEVGTHFDLGDGRQPEGDVLEVEAENFHQRVAHGLPHA